MALTDTFFNSASSDVADTNERIAELLSRTNVVSEDLRTLVASISLSPAYTNYVLNATVRGVRDYLEIQRDFGTGTGFGKTINIRENAQAVHDCIMAQAPEINAAAKAINARTDIIRTVSIADSAKLRVYTNMNSYERGAHRLVNIAHAHFQDPQFHIEINAANRTDGGADLIKTIAHETAHHMEIKLALAQHWSPQSVPEEFQMDAVYFHSLHMKKAHVQGSADHELYRNQANERMARAAGAEARATAQKLTAR